MSKTSLEDDDVFVKSEKLSDDYSETIMITPQKRRGRKPKPKDPNALPPTVRLDKDGNVIPKKPRKPRKKEEKGSRKPYRKRTPKIGVQTATHGDNISTVPIKSEFVREITSETNQELYDLPLIETFKTEASLSSSISSSSKKNNEDINTLLFSSLFNKRIISDMSVVDESAAFLFRKIDECIKNSEEDSPEERMFRMFEEKLKIIYNKTTSLEKVLGPFCINLMRGYLSSKMSPIPISRPWDIRTEVMNNDSITWMDLQTAVNQFCKEIQIQQYNDEKTDEELLSQKASSFFSGKAITNDNIPQYLFNSDWLIEATESRGAAEKVVVGGGDTNSSNNRTHSVHTVIHSFRGDLNHGIELPDLPLSASKIMELDKQETNMNSQKTLPISDPLKFV